MSDPIAPADPFDLPDWLGTDRVTWTPDGGLRSGSSVPGVLSAPDRPPLPCDLLAVDDAFPEPVAPDTVRLAAHQAWRRGEVSVVERRARLTLAVPGSFFTADVVLDALARLARAVGADAGRYAVLLRIGESGR